MKFNEIAKRYIGEEISEPIDHKQKMVNIASEIAGISTRISRGEVRTDDGERLLELAKSIEAEYK